MYVRLVRVFVLLVGSEDGSDSVESVGNDLAVLSLSNHTITSRGSFSMWAALLCGGEYYGEYGVIVPAHRQQHRHNKRKPKRRKGEL